LVSNKITSRGTGIKKAPCLQKKVKKKGATTALKIKCC
jgi:hypothetical protein